LQNDFASPLDSFRPEAQWSKRPLLFLSVDAALRLMKPVAYESGELCRTLLMQEMPSTGPDDLVIWTVGQGLLPLGSFGGHAGVDNQHRAFPSLEIALGHERRPRLSGPHIARNVLARSEGGMHCNRRSCQNLCHKGDSAT